MDRFPDLSIGFQSTSMGLKLHIEEDGKTERDAIFSNLKGIPRDFVDCMQLIANYMRDSFAENFDAEGRPSWESLSPAYKAQREFEGNSGPILHITGALREEVAGDGSGHVEEIIDAGNSWTLIMGGSSDIFNIHQAGASGSRGPVFASPGRTLRWFGPGGEVYFADSVGGASFEIPARPMVVLQDEDKEAVVQIIRSWVYEKMGI